MNEATVRAKTKMSETIDYLKTVNDELGECISMFTVLGDRLLIISEPIEAKQPSTPADDISNPETIKQLKEIGDLLRLKVGKVESMIDRLAI